ncbi:MAG: LysR family transcriptional regulator [Sandaracinaceae bacterium]|nr:LysR family transcriptional regulator [Sandaracinaceae bacterium]
MNLDGLRNLLLIVEHGTFTEAARHAHLSQPALTASMRRLEEQLGARLLARGRHGATLTAAGAALLPSARAALAAVEEGRRAVLEIEELARGEVRLGAGATACTYLLPPTLAAFRRAHPGVRLWLRELTTDEAREAIDAGSMDLAVVTDPGPHGELWFEDELVLVAAPGIDPAGAPFVTFRSGATTRALLEERFPGADIAMELGGVAAVKTHVRMGIGVALVSRHAVRTDLALGRLVELDDPRTPIRRPMHLVHRGRDRLAPAARALRELMLSAPPVPLDELAPPTAAPPQSSKRRSVAQKPARPLK